MYVVGLGGRFCLRFDPTLSSFSKFHLRFFFSFTNFWSGCRLIQFPKLRHFNHLFYVDYEYQSKMPSGFDYVAHESNKLWEKISSTCSCKSYTICYNIFAFGSKRFQRLVLLFSGFSFIRVLKRLLNWSRKQTRWWCLKNASFKFDHDQPLLFIFAKFYSYYFCRCFFWFLQCNTSSLGTLPWLR